MIWKWIGVTIVAAVVAVCIGCTQPPIRPNPGIEDKIDRDALGSFREGVREG
jgi:hypothetical protein